MKIMKWCNDCDGTGIRRDSAGNCQKCGGRRLIEATAKDIPVEIQREIVQAWWEEFTLRRCDSGDGIEFLEGVKR
jgi:RecJ-like exonuclease